MDEAEEKQECVGRVGAASRTSALAGQTSSGNQRAAQQLASEAIHLHLHHYG